MPGPWRTRWRIFGFWTRERTKMNEEMRHEIVRRRQGGASLRRIAKDLGLARDTVQSVVRRWETERAGHGTSGPLPVPNRRPSRVDPFNDTIQQLLQRYLDIT